MGIKGEKNLHLEHLLRDGEREREGGGGGGGRREGKKGCSICWD